MATSPDIPSAIVDQLIESFRAVGTGIVSEHWPILLLVVFIAILARIARSPTVKGLLGEASVKAGALRKLEKEGCRIFNDLILPRPDGKGTTQIDHVIASRGGIFVVETKNYSGWIFGDAKSRQWTQTLRGKKSRFQNPLHQNALHINALVAATGIPKDQFENLVYFVGDAVLKTELPENVMTRGLADYVRGRRVPVVTDDELRELSEVLERFRANGSAASRAHRSQMKGRRLS